MKQYRLIGIFLSFLCCTGCATSSTDSALLCSEIDSLSNTTQVKVVEGYDALPSALQEQDLKNKNTSPNADNTKSSSKIEELKRYLISNIDNNNVLVPLPKNSIFCKQIADEIEQMKKQYKQKIIQLSQNSVKQKTVLVTKDCKDEASFLVKQLAQKVSNPETTAFDSNIKDAKYLYSKCLNKASFTQSIHQNHPETSPYSNENLQQQPNNSNTGTSLINKLDKTTEDMKERNEKLDLILKKNNIEKIGN